jgi:hypothetical protein
MNEPRNRRIFSLQMPLPILQSGLDEDYARVLVAALTMGLNSIELEVTLS